MLLLDELHMDCFGQILKYLNHSDIRTLFETNYKLASLIISCIGGPPAKMLTLRNASRRAEASRQLIYSVINLEEDFFYSNAIYDVVNLVIAFPTDMEKLMKMFRSLQRQTKNGIYYKWKELNLICTQTAVITEELAEELCKFQYHSFACSAEHIARDVSLLQFLKSCEKAENIWLMSPHFTIDFMSALEHWTYKGNSNCSIVFQNPSHEASIIELPPEEFLINFCENFPTQKLLLSIVIDTEEFEADRLPNYVQILSARLPEFEITSRNSRITIKNISMYSFEMFVIAANVLKTPTQIFLFEDEENEEGGEDDGGQEQGEEEGWEY
uniref:F-box domain-containing protein n=1 Tax=Panagrolaimus sp. PS1159 TaxID=55785 RepID=A0AC35FQ10_9BILA